MKIAEPKRDDLISDDSDDHQVNQPRCPLCDELELAGTFLLIIAMEPKQRIVQFSTDFAGVIEIREKLWKLPVFAQNFRGRSPALYLRFPRQHCPAKRRRTTGRGRQFPRFDD